MMIPFEGRYSHRQHVKGKPHDTGHIDYLLFLISAGLKVYCIVDQFGFLIDLWLFEGKSTSEPTAGGDARSSKPKEIVLQLLDDLLRRGYSGSTFILTCDSFYSSFDLAEALHSKYIAFVLSCRKDCLSGLFANGLHEEMGKGTLLKLLLMSLIPISQRRSCYYTHSRLQHHIL